jgi:AraC family transcriptional regulator of adaptative response/methylated-DNA-[protein]-cysteine methyltransferase
MVMINKTNTEYRTLFKSLISKNATTEKIILKAAWIDTVLGPMIAMTDEHSLYLLEFLSKKELERDVARLRQKGFVFVSGNTSPLTSIDSELNTYFEGKLTSFKTPYRLLGSPFQQQVWKSLCQIPYGETRSYAEQSASLGKPSAYRAVANANGANRLAIIIPCHRVIASDGTLGGYGGGLKLKEWLINHEQQYNK